MTAGRQVLVGIAIGAPVGVGIAALAGTVWPRALAAVALALVAVLVVVTTSREEAR